MALLGRLTQTTGICLVAAVLLMANTAYGHHMGRTVPIGFSGEGADGLPAQVVAEYFEEQMGRETKLVRSVSPVECAESVRAREFPMAVLPALRHEELPEGVVMLQGTFGPPGNAHVLVMGGEARSKLEFSLVPRYLEKLSGIDPVQWEKAVERVEAGEGLRGVALEMLRKADLL